MKEYIGLSARIYNIKRVKEYRRIVVFMIRSVINNAKMKELITFFQKDALLSDIASHNPFIFEQVTRQIFYHKSTFLERLSLIKEHFVFLKKYLNEEALHLIYTSEGLTLWQQECQNEMLSLSLSFHGVNKKEGLITFELKLQHRIYHATFWIALDKNGEISLWIGALQGSLKGSKKISDLTKYFYGYRPKNLIVYGLRLIATGLNIRKIYAVSNCGFYANNHIRLDRKLKTSLDEFWEETGGILSRDNRFYELPLIEPRKSLDEVKSQKRNLYKKRFALLDEMSNVITQKLTSYLVI